VRFFAPNSFCFAFQPRIPAPVALVFRRPGV